MRKDLFKHIVTIYSSYIDEVSKKKEYKKKVIYDTLIFESDNVFMDTTGVRKHTAMTLIIPSDNKWYTSGYVKPSEYTGQSDKFTLKCGDYIASGIGESFKDIAEIKKTIPLYQITDVEIKDYGNASHLFIRGV